MNQESIKTHLNHILQIADIHADGNNPWDIKILNQNFYPRLIKDGTLALGESYVDGWWDCKRLDLFFERVFKANLESKIKSDKWLLLKLMMYKFVNMQTKTRSLEVGKVHYDLGNQLFECMLDHSMNYTCGYWRNAQTLDEAQTNKMQLTCDKLMLKPGMRLLDIGCGFGALAKFAAQNYGVSVVGVTISKEQCEYAQNNCAGLPVEIRFQDYRDVHEKFDRIVSLGMFEHVGYLNYHAYMNVVHECLADDGLFLLHTIGSNVSTTTCEAWFRKYIFPNGMLPSIRQIGDASEKLFVMEDWHNFGADYEKTLMCWFENFNQNWPQLRKQYDERFYRMWSYYLLSCAGMFRARLAQLWQIVFSKNGVQGGYHVPRL